MKQKLIGLQREIDILTVSVGDLSSTPSVIEISSRQKMYKDKVQLSRKSLIIQLDLTFTEYLIPQ